MDDDVHRVVQGWQEMTDAAVTHLLRTVLAKSAKDAAVNPSPLTIPTDTGKVKKHIALLCDRLGKGARLVEGLAGKRRSRDLITGSPHYNLQRGARVGTGLKVC